MLITAFLATLVSALGADLPDVVVIRDDTRILRSCRIVIPKATVIQDSNGNGVLLIEASNIVVVFAPGSILRGAPDASPGDTLTGTGIRMENREGVTLRGLRVRGFKLGLHAVNCSRLTVEDSSFDKIFRQHLRSTLRSEDSGDWLSPHANDEDQWLQRYGAAVSLKSCRDCTIRRVRVRESQNGIVLSKVIGSRFYDNDASFLSGWGLALWRSSENVIMRNALDFCIRGYSHGVYNRGQDSAGILMFEQCMKNIVAENSVTHGGDGIFAFAGNDALESNRRAGCNGNLFFKNDLSYAAAHGLELTFSFDNRVIDNRLVENAICGIWGGYSQDTLIQGNRFEGNGKRGYGLERGGINIEHGFRNTIAHNTFSKNACGVHLWWDRDEALAKKPWAIANEKGSRDNVIAHNRFDEDRVAIHLRKCLQTRTRDNHMTKIPREIDCDDTSAPVPLKGRLEIAEPGTIKILGTTHPVGARSSLAGREHIIMTEWGPWDHQSPLPPAAAERVLMHADWSIRVFPWTVDPRKDLAGWRREARGARSHVASSRSLELVYGQGGPSQVGLSPTIDKANLSRDRFGTVASCKLTLDEGEWRISTLSDDGVRVTADGKIIIDNWTWHGPTRNTGVLTLHSRKTVQFLVEHFELDGHAVLTLEIEQISSK